MTTKSAGAYNHINYTTETEYKALQIFFLLLELF